MSLTTENPCARTILFAGEARTFNLNTPKTLAAMSAGNLLNDMPLAMKFAGRAPFEGQYGSTPAAVLKRFLQTEYSVSDIENVIALGLIGGGMSVDAAFDLVAQHVTGKPLAANAVIASEVISALFVGAVEAA